MNKKKKQKGLALAAGSCCNVSEETHLMGAFVIHGSFLNA